MLIVLAAAAFCSDFAAPTVDIQAMKRKAAESGAAVQGAAVQRPRVMSGSVDMTDFLTLLEDMTLDTTVLRGLLGQISVSFRPPTNEANAEYGWILNHLYLPDSLRDPKTGGVRYNLNSSEISTVIHELTHAAEDLLASGSAPAGSPAYEHHQALAMLASQVRDGAWAAHKPRTKANELASYYMGRAVADVADALDALRIYNARLGGGGTLVSDEEQARRLGGHILLFDQKPVGARPGGDAPQTWKDMQHRMLGHADVINAAQLGGRDIGVEPAAEIKGRLFQNALGLKPPLSVRELVDRLNDPQRRSPGIDALRQEALEARLKSARSAVPASR